MSSSTVSIRRARPDDVPVILSFIRQLADYERLTKEVVVDEQALHEHLFGTDAVAEALIAESDAAAHGFALFFRSFSTFLGRPGIYLEDLFVVPDFRGRGIGRALLQSLAQLAVERGYGRLEWAVLDWNAPAIDFYERIGAEPLSGWIVNRLTGDALHALAGPDSDT